MPLLRPCKNTAAFEVLPDTKGQLDLDHVESVLVEAGYRRKVRAGVMLIMAREIEVSVYKSGKMLIKTRDPQLAQSLARELLAAVAGGDAGLRVEGLDRLVSAPRGPGVKGD